METFIASMLDRLLATGVQTALLTAVVWLLCRWVPRLSPATQCWLWWLVALQGLVGLCVDPIPLRWLPAESAAATIVTVMDPTLLPADGAGAAHATATMAWSWQADVLLLWLAGIAVMVGLTLRDWRRTRELLRSSVACQDERLTHAVSAAAGARGLHGTPRLRWSEHIHSPLVIGHFRPVLLLPATASLSDEELEMAVAHELEHLRRGDLWWGFIPMLAQHLFFFHPLVHLAAREYGTAREAACDAAVVGGGDRSRHHYGELLVRLGTVQRTSNGLAVASPTFRALSMRLKLLQHSSFLPRAGSIAVLLLALAFVMPLRLVAAATGPAVVYASAAAPAALPPITIAAPSAAPNADRKLQIAYRPDIEAFYPPLSRSLGEEGTARLRICLDEAGNVLDVTLAEPSRFPRLDEAALRAGRNFRFIPAIVGGRPVGQCVVQPMRFSAAAGQVQSAPASPSGEAGPVRLTAAAQPTQAGGGGSAQPLPGDRKAQVVSRPDIRDFYSAESRTLGEEGTTRVRICIDEAGRITDSTVAESSGFARLDEAAVQYARRMRFRPAMVNGAPAGQCFLQPVLFAAKNLEGGVPQFSGERITVAYQDIPVRALLQQLSGISGRTIVVDESVNGSVTLSVENVPWDQVLAIVLQTKGLEQRVQGNEIVIAAAGVLPPVK